jgi:choline/glycine/proline betaine transport protein
MPGGNQTTTSLEAVSDEDKFHRAEVHLSAGGQDYCVMGWTREQVAMDVLNQYSQHVQFLQSIR